MSLSFPCIWVPGSSFILASCLIGKEAISSILLDQWHGDTNFKGSDSSGPTVSVPYTVLHSLAVLGCED